ncbi:MAG: DUF4272 domain-containing protein [Verrucomicrobiota bacterium]
MSPEGINPDARIPDFPEVEEVSYQAGDDEEEEECEPPDANRVARRMCCLEAVAARGLIDMNLMQGNPPAYKTEGVLNWVDQIGIRVELEPKELKILETEARQLPQQDTLDSVWRLEGLVVLAWALGLSDLPAYDQVVNTDELLANVGFGPDSFKAQSIVADPILIAEFVRDLKSANLRVSLANG